MNKKVCFRVNYFITWDVVHPGEVMPVSICLWDILADAYIECDVTYLAILFKTINGHCKYFQNLKIHVSFERFTRSMLESRCDILAVSILGWWFCYPPQKLLSSLCYLLVKRRLRCVTDGTAIKSYHVSRPNLCFVFYLLCYDILDWKLKNEKNANDLKVRFYFQLRVGQLWCRF